MATKTKNYGFPKPEMNDYADITVIGAAFEQIDTAMKTVEETASDTRVLEQHIKNKNNPHNVTAAQVGARANTWLPTAGEIGAAKSAELAAHINSRNNPHNVTAAQLRVSNRNLLDNWYFGNPVNQRGQMEYVGTGYGIDRWRAYGGTTTIADGGVKLVRDAKGIMWFQQYIEDCSGLYRKAVTLSVLVQECYGTVTLSLYGGTGNGIYSLIGDTGTLKGGLNTVTASINQKYTSLYVQIGLESGAGVVVEAVKLELGTEQTLAHQEDGKWVLNEIPSYAEELAKCQRYLLPIDGVGRYPATISGTTDAVQIFVPTPVSMRAVPSISGSFKVSFRTNTGAYNTTSFAVSSTLLTTAGFLILGTAAWTSSKPAIYQGGVAVLTEKVFASAEL